MKKIKYIGSLILLGLLASCSGDNNSVTLEVDPQLGELGDFITVTDKNVIVKLVDEKEDSTDIRSIVSSLAINVNKSVASDYSFGFDVAVLDEDHVEIASLPNYDINSETDYEADRNCHYVLSSGPNRAQMKWGRDASDWDSDAQEMWDKIRTKGKYIAIRPERESAKFIPYKSGSTSSAPAVVATEEVVESASDSDFDETLAAYENFVDKYIALLQKAEDGDYTAFTDAASLAKDAQEYDAKLKRMSGSLTPAQLAKFEKVQMKLLNAMQ